MRHIPTYEEFVNESVLNEGRVKAATLLQEIMDGNTSRAEGIKMSKDLAEHYLYWLRTSPYGKKNTDLPLYMLIKASFFWGIERQLDPKLKVELDTLKTTINKPVKESIDAKYWEDYNTDTSGQGKKEFANKSKDFEDTFSLAVSEWNDEADGPENRVKGAQITKVKKIAQEFFKKEGWISVNVAQAMIAQES